MRGLRARWLLVVAAACAAPACTCGKSAGPAAAADAGDVDASVAIADASVDASRAAGGRLSLPIAATRTRDEKVLVAGLVVADKAIAVVALDGASNVVGQSTVIEGAGWTSGAELRFLAGPSGPALFFHGVRDGKRADLVVRLDEAGRASAAPMEVGPSPCRVGDDVVWLASGKAHVLSLTSRAARTVALSSGDGEATVACSSDDARVLWEHEGDHDDEPVLRRGDAGASRRPLFRDADFPDDEAREVAEYTWAGGLGWVRVGHAGSLALRESSAGALAPVKKVGTKVGDDDLVAVDSSLAAVHVVATHEDEEPACDSGASAPAVRVVRVDRASQEVKVVPVAPAACGRERGPFTTEIVDGKLVVWWVERARGRGRSAPPIAGLGWGEVTDGASPRTGFVEVAADGLAHAGCAHGRCYAVALERPPGEDGMKPEPVRVLTFP